MKQTIGAENPYVHADITIIPLFRSRTATFPGGAAGDKEPIGVLIHSGTTLCIHSFTGSYTWWDELTDSYPGMKILRPVFPEREPYIQKR